MRSAAGLLALQAFPSIGEAAALRHALLSTDFDPFLDEHARLWETELKAAQEEIEQCREDGIAVISIFEGAYPQRLRAIVNPPPVLYVQGNVEALCQERTVAIAGGREPGEVACAATERIVTSLSGQGWAVVGGLGSGVETVAHSAAVANGKPTVAVMPGGLNQITPKANHDLAEAIVGGGGALVSPFRMGFVHTRSSAAIRDRIATALSLALVLTQGRAQDSAMYWARDAAIQGRSIFCVKPADGDAEGEGLHVLLTSPATRLHEMLPAWKGKSHLCANLGTRPLAQATAPDKADELHGALERILEEERKDPPAPRWWPEPKRRGGRVVTPAAQASASQEAGSQTATPQKAAPRTFERDTYLDRLQEAADGAPQSNGDVPPATGDASKEGAVDAPKATVVAPQADGGAPQANDEAPQANSDVTQADDDAPQTGDDGTPAGAETAPADPTKATDAAAQTSDAPKVADASEADGPESDTAQTTADASKTTADGPEAVKDTPKADIGVPVVTAEVPEATTDAPEADGEASETTADTPQATDEAPQAADPPKATDEVAQAGAVPEETKETGEGPAETADAAGESGDAPQAGSEPAASDSEEQRSDLVKPPAPGSTGPAPFRGLADRASQ